MSVAVARDQLEVAMPAGWYRMPDPDAVKSRLWPFELVGRFGFQGEDALVAAASLDTALDVARRQATPRRLRWVLVGDPPVPAVQAWALLDLVPRVEPDAIVAADTYERGARTARPVDGDVAVWQREIGRRAVHDDPAVVIHDLLTVTAAPGAPGALQHRAVVALFLPQPVLVSLSVSTPLLAALPDVEALALEIAFGVTRWF